MLNEECRECLYQEYMTTAIKALTEAYVKVHGGEFTLPSFIEMTHTQQRKQTAEQVIAHLKEVFS